MASCRHAESRAESKVEEGVFVALICKLIPAEPQLKGFMILFLSTNKDLLFNIIYIFSFVKSKISNSVHVRVYSKASRGHTFTRELDAKYSSSEYFPLYW